jgi:hypothetical protein
MFGFACIFIFAVGVLIGQGLNGRAQIARDKSQAGAQRDLNERRRAIEIASRLAHQSPKE